MDNRPGKPAWYYMAQEYSERHIHTCCCGGGRYVHLDVPVGHPLFGKAIPCVCLRDQVARERGERLRRMSGLSGRELTDYTFEQFNWRRCKPEQTREPMKAALEICQDYARTLHGWLILSGCLGCGKTHLAGAIVHEVLNRGKSAYMNTMPDILDMLRQGYDDVVDFEQRFDLLRSVELLVIDDLGVENGTAWAHEKLYQIVNSRYQQHLPLVVTTNIVDLERDDSIDARIRSRLLEGTRVAGGRSRRLYLPAGDYRPYHAQGLTA